jgi:hypothetical protein
VPNGSRFAPFTGTRALQNSVVVVIGRKGSGKSTLVREIVLERQRVFVMDALKEYGPECGCDVVDEDACLDAIVDAYERRRRFRLSLRCLETEDNLDLIDVCYECPGVTVVVEETSLYVSPTTLPTPIAQMVRYGRHQQIDQVYVARRPSELHRDLTANADVIVTFQQQEPRDLLYLRSFFGDEALTLNRLPDYHIRVFGDLSRAPTCVLHRLAAQPDLTSTPEAL